LALLVAVAATMTVIIIFANILRIMKHFIVHLLTHEKKQVMFILTKSYNNGLVHPLLIWANAQPQWPKSR
jgi:hypothetical protein